MRILLVSATHDEIRPLLKSFDVNTGLERKGTIDWEACTLNFLITGVGSVQMAVNLSRELCKNSYDLIINAGVGGCFHHHIPLGQIYLVKEEIFGDSGIEEADGRFLDLFDIGLISEDDDPFIGRKVICEENLSVFSFPPARSLTVGMVTGTEETARSRYLKYAPDLESMEGGAFFYTASKFNQKFIQVRSVSNLVGKRNRQEWNLDLATKNLSKAVMEILQIIIRS